MDANKLSQDIFAFHHNPLTNQPSIHSHLYNVYHNELFIVKFIWFDNCLFFHAHQMWTFVMRLDFFLHLHLLFVLLFISLMSFSSCLSWKRVVLVSAGAPLYLKAIFQNCSRMSLGLGREEGPCGQMENDKSISTERNHHWWWWSAWMLKTYQKNLINDLTLQIWQDWRTFRASLWIFIDVWMKIDKSVLLK